MKKLKDKFKKVSIPLRYCISVVDLDGTSDSENIPEENADGVNSS